MSALRWAATHRDVCPKSGLVIGIRSIGIRLSALVQATLRSQGWDCTRPTVRPFGHPLQRKVQLRPAEGGKSFRASAALIVDEGPGISGSSMAAAAEAVAQLGILDISFLPGHERLPVAANPEVRRWWDRVDRFVTPLELRQ